jgi:hypothetical protein
VGTGGTTGSGGSTGTGGTAPNCEPDPTSVCDKCQTSKCCDVSLACYTDTACDDANTANETCIEGGTSIPTCYTKFSNTGAKAKAVVDCLKANCKTPCEL